MAISMSKSHIIFRQRNTLEQLLLWHSNASLRYGVPPRFTRFFPLVLLPNNHIFNSYSLSNRYCFNLPIAPVIPLLRRRLSPHFSPMSTLSSDSSPPAAKTVRAVIKGRVQGVFYRDWTVENAKELGLKGWVRNRRDGSVEALFSGSPEKVEEMEQRCRRGPPDAMVTGLQVFPCTDDPWTAFERKPTA